MANFQSNECITSLYIAQFYVRTAQSKILKIVILLSSSFSSSNSVVSSNTRLHITPLHFLARIAVYSQMSCSSCLSNNDIQTTDQISVLCITPCFHKETLTPPSTSRSPSFEGGGPTRMRHAMQLYITHSLYFEIYTSPLEGIQLMSIAVYETFVCVCFFAYKT